MDGKLHILGFAGSLRKGSYNRAILRAAVELVPPSAELEIFGLDGIPAFNQDLERTPPERVKEFKLKIKEADAILISTPEYNFSIPGVLKNAIDWASRPYGDNSFDDKPVAMMSASDGETGAIKAQFHLMQVFVFLNMHPLNHPQVVIGHVSQKVDADGKLTDGQTRENIKKMLEALVAWTMRIKK